MVLDEAKDYFRVTKRMPYNLISLYRLLKALLQQQQQKAKYSIKKWSEDLNRYFSKEDIQMANRHMKRCKAEKYKNENQTFSHTQTYTIFFLTCQ